MTECLVIGGITDEMRTRLDAKFTLHDLNGIENFDSWAAEHGAGIEAVCTNGHDGVKPEIMGALPALKVISCYGVGYDAIDTSACIARGIKVSHTPNVLNGEVANTTLLLILTALRNFNSDEAWARSGNWEAEGNAPLSRSPDGLTYGILGMGRIGQEIARRLEIFGGDILYHTRSKKDVSYEHVADLTEMAKRADVLICITPGGPSTEKLVNAQVMEALGPKGLLVNVSRGSVVDEDALVSALESGKLGMAALDVFVREPHIPDGLKSSERTVLLPHVGSATHETRAAMGNLTVDNLLQWLDDGSVQTPVPECAHM